ncbi:Cupredoxins domain-containing protein [Dioscorea alata]|uniref:Cupredoxins domain-containing protein n=1 Tax=Dioscorea alata TaxID=55571 RepID=A0ACB7U5H5_DIOAL|nr:Cupredoxins domain-containing protein [Dioscorea alata]
MVSATCKNLARIVLIMWSCVTWGSATVYTVGDSDGWNTGVDYSLWANDKTFVVGDSLEFNYASGLHNVDEVSSGDYQSCSTNNIINSDSSGHTRVYLSSSGRHHFICGVPGYCNQGMKLAVSVEDATNTPSTWNSYSPAGVLPPDALHLFFFVAFASWSLIKLLAHVF